MPENKIQSTSDALLKREKFYSRFPEMREHYKDWPYWDEDGYPMPNPAELATFISVPEIDADLNSDDEDVDEV